MYSLRAALITAPLSSSSACADRGPNWTAAIGTGRAEQSTSSSVATAAAKNTMSRVASPHWTSRIGTGRATELNAGTGSSRVAAARAQP
jgi:hypothetical protein